MLLLTEQPAKLAYLVSEACTGIKRGESNGARGKDCTFRTYGAGCCQSFVGYRHAAPGGALLHFVVWVRD